MTQLSAPIYEALVRLRESPSDYRDEKLASMPASVQDAVRELLGAKIFVLRSNGQIIKPTLRGAATAKRLRALLSDSDTLTSVLFADGELSDMHAAIDYAIQAQLVSLSINERTGRTGAEYEEQQAQIARFRELRLRLGAKTAREPEPSPEDAIERARRLV